MATRGNVTADASVAQANKNAAYFKKLLHGMRMGRGGMSSMRQADYHGHHISIETIYQITIDGKRFMGMLGVTNDGIVHYHGMPAAGFASALDLVKSVIDVFPDEFAKGSGSGNTHGMNGMSMTRRRTARKKGARRGKTAGRS